MNVSFAFQPLSSAKVNAESGSRPVGPSQPLALVLNRLEYSLTFAYRVKSKLLTGPIFGGAYTTPHLATGLDINSETLELEDKVVFDSLIPLRIGYRYQKPEGGFFFRVGYTPFFKVPVGVREDWVFTPIFAGISFGKSF